MRKLQEYLQRLNSSESLRGIWVNPENPEEEFRIGQYGGTNDNWILIGNLEALSFGYPLIFEAIEYYLKSYGGVIEYNNCKVRVNIEGILQAYSAGILNSDFKEFLELKAEEINLIWSREEAWNFIADELPNMIRGIR